MKEWWEILSLYCVLGDDGPQVKKPTMDPANISIPPVGSVDPQAIAQAAIAK